MSSSASYPGKTYDDVAISPAKLLNVSNTNGGSLASTVRHFDKFVEENDMVACTAHSSLSVGNLTTSGTSYNSIVVDQYYGNPGGFPGAKLNDHGAPRYKPDVVARSETGAATSYSTPTVCSAAAALLERASVDEAVVSAYNSVVVKALIMAGATRYNYRLSTEWKDTQEISTPPVDGALPLFYHGEWERGSDAHPTSAKYGAGHLNIMATYDILDSGEFDSGSSEAVEERGWDYASDLSVGDVETYSLDIRANSVFSAVLVWHRYIDDSFRSYLPDYSLSIYDEHDVRVAHSDSLTSNVELVEIELPAGSYRMEVSVKADGGSTDDLAYGLAWISKEVMSPVPQDLGVVVDSVSEWQVTWDSDETAEGRKYRLQVAADEAFSAIEKDVYLDVRSYTYAAPNDGKTKYFRVFAYPEDGDVAYYYPSSAGSTVSQLPSNSAPAGVGTLSDLALRVEDGAQSVEASGAFEDPDGDALTYAATSTAPAVAGVGVSGSLLTVTPLAVGSAEIAVTATDVGGVNLSATQTFQVRVLRPRGVEVTPANLMLTEGTSRAYSVVLSSEPSAAVTVVVTTSLSGTDLSLNQGSLTFAPGDWNVAQRVGVTAGEDADGVADPPVTLEHSVSGGGYDAVAAPSVLVTIVENDTPTISVEDARALEGAGSIIFTVDLSVASGSDVTVGYATSDVGGTGSATGGEDYSSVQGTLTFPAGTASPRQVAVPVMDDTVDEEEEETLRLTLSSANNAELAGGGSTLRVLGTIEDNDDPVVEVSFESVSYDVTEGGTANVDVRIDRDPERDLEVFLERTHHGGAEDADYSGVPASVTFSSDVRSRTLSVVATDDEFDDDGERVVLSFVSLPPRVTGGGETTITISDVGGGGGPGTGGSGGGGSGSRPASDGEDDRKRDGGIPVSHGPVRSMIATDAECPGAGLCVARSGVPVSFEDESTGAVISRLWEFGDGGQSRNRTVRRAWSLPGFYEVTLWTSDGTRESTVSLTFLVEPAAPSGTCVADPHTRCLQDSRYAVSVEWRTAGGAVGRGSVVHAGTNDSGIFHFFDPNNWEVLIKILDGCEMNRHVWVFSASTTNLGYTIEVTDTVTGEVKEYGNEPGRPAVAITDATAFRACVR
ncbi:MAG: PKD domain-containing protein [Holophagales bacterium]|nr:PKD domain-containing protein [Holophagales bacterium]MYF94116.1 PKD domain-containing protein [Holophagales bacterium]